MPWQAHVYIGIPIYSKADANEALKILGSEKTVADCEGGDALGFNDLVEEINATVTLSYNEKEHVIPLKLEAVQEAIGYDSMLEDFWADGQDSFMLIGIPLTARYKPAVIDEREDREVGRWDPFILDPDVLKDIRDQVRKAFNSDKFEVLMMDIWH